MNILHLSTAKNWGGGENHLKNLCRELQHLAPEVKSNILSINPSLFEESRENSNLKVFLAPLSFKMDPRYIFKIISICRNENIDLIHIHDTTALTLAVIADRLGDLPPFVFSKKTSFPIKPRKLTLYKYTYPKIKKILCVSIATQIITAESIPEHKKILCIYHGTDIKPAVNPSEIDLRKKLNLEAKAIIIGNIANHIRAKNLETFIKVAFELVHQRKNKDLHFVQIGAFTKRTRDLIKMIDKYNLQDHVHFLNEIKMASTLIPQFNISLMTSQSEGIPQFIYESLYHKVPVVSTNVGGINEVIEHKENGLLAAPYDAEEIADCLQLLISNPVLKEKITTNSRDKILNHFTTKKMALQTLEVYKEIIHGRN